MSYKTGGFAGFGFKAVVGLSRLQTDWAARHPIKVSDQLGCVALEHLS